MGGGKPGAGRQFRERDDVSGERIRGQITVGDLQRWEEHGAQWRAVEISDQRAVVELCTCYGEPVDMVQSEAPELIEFVRAHASR